MTEQWTSRWHITGNGQVIRQWSNSTDAGEQVFRRIPADRRPELSEIVALDEELSRFDTVWSRVTMVFVWLGALAILGVIFGLFGLPMYGVADSISLAVGVTSVIIIVLIPIAAIFIMRALRSRVTRLYAEAGLTDPLGMIVPAPDAEIMVGAPKTVSTDPTPAKAPDMSARSQAA
ncbi:MULTISPECIES: DUF2207 domain-containing protein [unclassified Brevibacterium]|uniref:DUF2207 domain-containing protein n=1 Tax=unclassified Brevibacterium TaxID=2614124 RepID=UPI0010F749FB|nr:MULTISPECIES: DUF2207 domain-containing protein [unclassified Brevibacterium]MCM1013190.1 hypothetical protein [Brevibacterium sp. XM4083]